MGASGVGLSKDPVNYTPRNQVEPESQTGLCLRSGPYNTRGRAPAHNLPACPRRGPPPTLRFYVLFTLFYIKMYKNDRRRKRRSKIMAHFLKVPKTLRKEEGQSACPESACLGTACPPPPPLPPVSLSRALVAKGCPSFTWETRDILYWALCQYQSNGFYLWV